MFATACALHIALVLAVGHYRNPNLWENGVIAEYLVSGRGFRFDFAGPGTLTSLQAPGYPFLLALAWSILGKGSTTSFLLVSVVQAALVSSIVFPVRWLATRWFGSREGTVAMWIALAMPLYAWYATRVHQTAIVMAFHPWLLWGWLTVSDRTSWRRSVAVGGMTGVAGLFQPLILGATAGVAAARSISAALHRDRVAVAKLVVAGCVTLVVLTPWTVRNYRVHGQLVPVKDSFGKEFWMGNNPYATGTGYARGGAVEITDAHPPQAFSLRGRVSETVLIGAMFREAADFSVQRPRAFLSRTLQKIVWYWTMTPADLVRSGGGGEALRLRWAHVSYWMVLVSLGGIAVAFGKPPPRDYGLVIGWYTAFYSVVYGLTHVGQARFRGEIEFLFLPLVASGVLIVSRSDVETRRRLTVT